MQNSRSSFSEINNSEAELYWEEPPGRNIDFANNDECNIEKRKEETILQREIRLAKDASRTAERRKKEQPPERRKRLAESAAYTAQKRKMETPLQREARLAKDAARTAERRKKETNCDREKRLGNDAARHACKRSLSRPERHLPNDYVTSSEWNNNLHSSFNPSSSSSEYNPQVHYAMPIPNMRPSPESVQQRPRPLFPMTYQSKYSELLNVIEDLGREIKPTYAGSRMAQDRLKKGIMHARELVVECLAEVEKSGRQ